MKINEKQLWYKHQTEYAYAGISIFADYGIHEWVFSEFMKYEFRSSVKILILWAGAGAFDQRIMDAGYKNITSIDIEPKFYKAKNSHILQKDLNQDFWDLWKFDIIFAIEIIEHLENQFHFIRNIKECLADWGYCFLSTPNVESKFSRIGFFVSWSLHSFSKDWLAQFWHINPIHSHLLEYSLNESRLNFVKKWWFSKFTINRNSWILLIKSLLIRLISVFISWSDNITHIYSIHNVSHE
jgi:2-polyprenyl-3-methyl-5-hydroxy-6-metoxy-1,4-benzoquinol methylase